MANKKEFIFQCDCGVKHSLGKIENGQTLVFCCNVQFDVKYGCGRVIKITVEKPKEDVSV